MHHLYIAALECKKALLWATMLVLNVPLGFKPLYKAIKYRDEPLPRLFERTPETEYNFYDDAPLVLLTRRVAAKLGVNVKKVTMVDLDSPVMSGAVSVLNSKNVRKIQFQGYPLDRENGEQVVLGIIGHELGHRLTSGDVLFKRLVLGTRSEYLGLSKISASLGLLAPEYSQPVNDAFLSSFQKFPEAITGPVSHTINMFSNRPLLLSVAATALLIAYAVPRIGRSFMHNMEYLADLDGAKTTGVENSLLAFEQPMPDGAMSDVEAIDKYLFEKPMRAPSKLAEGSPLLPLIHAWKKAEWEMFFKPYFETHPETTDRVSLIKKAFNVRDNENAKPSAASSTQPQFIEPHL